MARYVFIGFSASGAVCGVTSRDYDTAEAARAHASELIERYDSVEVWNETKQVSAPAWKPHSVTNEKAALATAHV